MSSLPFRTSRWLPADHDCTLNQYQTSPDAMASSSASDRLVVHSAEAALDRAVATAMGDLFGNIQPRRAGLLTEARPVITAGLHYPDLWLRDAAVNAWNAGSLVAPAAARDGLLAVVEKRAAGYVLPHADYYDGVIWNVGAWHHARATGDADFLALALEIASDVLTRFRREEFNADTGLYRGGSFFNDGVSGYPERYARPTGEWGNIRDWCEGNPQRAPVGGGLTMQCLSTNCLHLLGLEAALEMAAALAAPTPEPWRAQADALRAAIRGHFYDAPTGRLRYLVDAAGSDDRQEIGGWAFACLAGVLDPAEQAVLATRVERVTFGTPSLWPTYERYAAAGGYGRHSGLVWPHVLAFWGDACAQRRDVAGLGRELRCLAEAAMRHGNFTECWNPVHGGPEGGLQERHDGTIIRWPGFPRTTWGATGLLRLVVHGVAGLRLRWDGLTLEPALPAGLAPLRLEGLRWRNLSFTLTLIGEGTRLAAATVNGAPAPRISFLPGDFGHREITATLTH